MRVLLTGAAGFIGSQIADLLVAESHELVALDALLPQAHGGELPEWSRRHDPVVGDVRDARLLDRLLAGVDAVCHQAAMVGHGLDPSDAPDYVSHNDYGTAVLLAAMHRAGVTRLVLASSMVVYGEGRYVCAAHGAVRPASRSVADLAAGRYEPTCPDCGGTLSPALVSEDALLEPRSTYAATKLAQEHLAAAWARQTGGASGRCATTTSTVPGCPGTPRTRAWRRFFGPHWRRACRRGCWRTAGSAATSSTSPTSPGPTCWR